MNVVLLIITLSDKDLANKILINHILLINYTKYFILDFFLEILYS